MPSLRTQGENANADNSMNTADAREYPAATAKPSSPVINCSHDELVAIEKLAPNPRNSNRHPPSQIALLSKIIAHQGWRAPIVVSTRSGLIVAGHGRYEAAKALGLVKVPVDYQDFATEADEWAHLIADNRLVGLAESDNEALRVILSELQACEVNTELAGFDDNSLAEILAEAGEPTPPDDFQSVDENLATDYACPKCGFKWSGKPA